MSADNDRSAEFACFTGDCAHEIQGECNAAIRAEYTKLRNEVDQLSADFAWLDANSCFDEMRFRDGRHLVIQLDDYPSVVRAWFNGLEDDTDVPTREIIRRIREAASEEPT